MIKASITAFLLLACAAAAGAQSASKSVIWTGDPNCGPRRGIGREEPLSCSTVVTQRGPVSSITYNGIELTVAFAEQNNFNLVAAQIVNRTREPVAFDTDGWGAAHFRSREDFMSRKSPLRAETSLPTRDIVRSMAAQKRLGDSLETMMGDMAMTAETREIRKLDGTKTKVTVIVPDPEAKTDEAGRRTTREEVVAAEQARIRETALTAKSVRAGAAVKGLVYFRRVANANFLMFSLAVADVIFVFRVPRPRKS
jgi:hypothetical protein